MRAVVSDEGSCEDIALNYLHSGTALRSTVRLHGTALRSLFCLGFRV